MKQKFNWKTAKENIDKAMKSKDYAIIAPSVIVAMAMWRNKTKLISPKSFKKYLENPWFIQASRYALGDYQMIDNEVGIDGSKLERIVFTK